MEETKTTKKATVHLQKGVCEICGLTENPETMEFSLANEVWIHPECQTDMETDHFSPSTPVGLRLACTKCGELTLDRGQNQSLCGNCV